MEVTELGIIYSPALAQGNCNKLDILMSKSTPSSDLNVLLSSETVMLCRLEQPENAEVPIEVTEPGILREVRLEQVAQQP